MCTCNDKIVGKRFIINLASIVLRSWSNIYQTIQISNCGLIPFFALSLLQIFACFLPMWKGTIQVYWSTSNLHHQDWFLNIGFGILHIVREPSESSPTCYDSQKEKSDVFCFWLKKCYFGVIILKIIIGVFIMEWTSFLLDLNTNHQSNETHCCQISESRATAIEACSKASSYCFRSRSVMARLFWLTEVELRLCVFCCNVTEPV